MMVSLVRSRSNNQDFIDLVSRLDADLNHRNGVMQWEYNQYNVIQSLDTVIVAYIDALPVGCGCFKPFDSHTVEIKRMFVKPENRGMGIAKTLLAELEKWAVELGYSKSILETGMKQSEAIGLYEKSGYSRIENYGQYLGMSHSICFEKDLKQ